jgi:hypothetical protein
MATYAINVHMYILTLIAPKHVVLKKTLQCPAWCRYLLLVPWLTLMGSVILILLTFAISFIISLADYSALAVCLGYITDHSFSLLKDC